MCTVHRLDGMTGSPDTAPPVAAAAGPEIAPATVAEVSAVLRDTGGLAVATRGGGTKAHWGVLPRRRDLVVDLRRLDQIVDHAAGDMVVQVQAGVRLAKLAAALAEVGQQWAVDYPSYDDGTALDAGTVGGALAVGLAGPRRFRYGGVRDLLLGVTMVRADGAVASAGGRVVKNVAGYDLGKLLCGSYGTLGLIVEATLRLHPLPEATYWTTVTVGGLPAAYTAARALVDGQYAPTAVEIDRPAPDRPVTVAAHFDGTAGAAAARARAAAVAAGGVAVDGPPGWWGRWPGGPDGTLVEVVFPPAALVEVVDLVDAAAGAGGCVVAVRGSAGVAALHIALSPQPDEETVARFLAVLREGLAAYGGHAVVRHAPEPVRRAVDMWGPVPPGVLALMRRVKDQFDPEHRLAPGCFVGGI
jgi:glycolate oxidase FAD binding subunit